MTLYLIVDAFRKLGSPEIKNDDFYDQLSRRYSLIVLGISFLIIASSQFFGSPINCYTLDAHGGHVGYVNLVCWMNGSYHVPFNESLPLPSENKRHYILYYQWVPFILLSMMFLFYLPGFIWRNLNKSCGINTKVIVKMVTDMDQLDGEKREKSVRTLAKHIDKALAYHREYEYGFLYKIYRRLASPFCCLIGRHSGNYLVWAYFFVKLLYIGNACCQIFLLDLFIGSGFSRVGFDLLRTFLRGGTSGLEKRFGRINMCDFRIRTLGDNVQQYTVQCLFPINIYNEKIFAFIWFWLVFITCASTYGLIKWLYYCTSSSRMNFIERFLQANDIPYYSSSTPSSLSTTGIGSTSDNDDQLPVKRVEDFVTNYCRQDGLLLLRIIKTNTNNIIAGEIICALWDNWKVIPQIRFNTSMRSDHRDQMLSLNMKNRLKQCDTGEIKEKLLPPM